MKRTPKNGRNENNKTEKRKEFTDGVGVGVGVAEAMAVVSGAVRMGNKSPMLQCCVRACVCASFLFSWSAQHSVRAAKQRCATLQVLGALHDMEAERVARGYLVQGDCAWAGA